MPENFDYFFHGIKSNFFKVKHPAACFITKKETNDHLTQQLFIKYQYSYMFRLREVIVRLAVEYFNILLIITTAGSSNSCRFYSKTDASMYRLINKSSYTYTHTHTYIYTYICEFQYVVRYRKHRALYYKE